MAQVGNTYGAQDGAHHQYHSTSTFPLTTQNGNHRYTPARPSFTGDSSSHHMSATGKGILIGMLSAFGSALLIVIILVLVYLLGYTNRGRIFLDRIGRPGEYDDEQQFLKEETEALEQMDDIQRSEYLRAKGKTFTNGFLRPVLTLASIHSSQSSRVLTNRHLAFAVFGNTREGCISMGV